MEYLIFKQNFLKIPTEDMAGADYIVCLDPLNRIGHKKWMVTKIDSITKKAFPQGLFWEKEMAIQFVESFK